MNTIATRQILIHYHLFKNAGSTVDHILQNNFGKDWLPFDGEKAHSRILPAELAEFIGRNPAARVVSSHNAVLPLPSIPGVSVIPIVFLRHPIDRVRSIYEFERMQGMRSGPVSKGAEHAAKLDFDEYIQWRLDTSRNGVTHNYQTSWLLHNPRFNRFEIEQKDFELAVRNLTALPFFGLVEHFDESLSLLSDYLASNGLQMNLGYQVKNTSKHHEKPLHQRLDDMRKALSEKTWSNIELRNQWDLKLYEAALNEFRTRSGR